MASAIISQARENRMTIRAGELEKIVVGDVDVALVGESKEWQGDADSGDEAGLEEEKLKQVATEQFQAREKRMTIRAGDLEKLVVEDAGALESSSWKIQIM